MELILFTFATLIRRWTII